MIKLIKGIVAASAFFAFASSATLADQTLRTSSAFGPKHTVAVGYKAFLKALDANSNGTVTGKDFPSGLVSPKEMVTGLRDGLVDAGTLLMAYFPSEFKDSNLPSELGLLGVSSWSSSAATTEYIITCPECLAEFSVLGTIYTGSSATTAYQILSQKPIRTLAEFKGVKVRSGSAAYSRWAAALGAIPVEMPAPEVFQALSQGIVDAHINTPGDLPTYQLYDIIKAVTVANIGTYNGVSTISIRKALWDGLTANERSLFWDAAQVGGAAVVEAYYKQVNEAIEEAKKRGIEFVDPADDFKAASAAFLDADMKAMEERLTKRGIKNSAEKIARFLALVKKWIALTDGITDAETFQKLLASEIYSKVDLNKYQQ